MRFSESPYSIVPELPKIQADKFKSKFFKKKKKMCEIMSLS